MINEAIEIPDDEPGATYDDDDAPGELDEPTEAAADPDEEAEQEEESTDDEADDSTDDEPDPEAEEDERVEFTDAQQKKINAIQAKTTAKLMERMREADEARQRAEQKLQQLLPQQQDEGRPEIPEKPDRYDDGYDEKMEARDKALVEAAIYDREKEGREQAARQQQDQQQQEMVTQLAKIGTDYNARAKKAGISPAEVKMIGMQVMAELQPALMGHVLTDENGPQIAKYLANNPLEMDKVKDMQPMRAAAYIESTIKPKATQPAKRPPKPTESPKGFGAKEGSDDLPGVKYE